MARQLPVLAIDRFGGSAAKIWAELATKNPNYPSANTHDASALVGWLAAAGAPALAHGDAAHRPELARADYESDLPWAEVMRLAYASERRHLPLVLEMTPEALALVHWADFG